MVLTIIERCCSIGLDIVAVTTDMGSGNRSMWQYFKVREHTFSYDSSELYLANTFTFHNNVLSRNLCCDISCRSTLESVAVLPTLLSILLYKERPFDS